MHGIVSLLQGDPGRSVERTWDDLERAFGLRGIRLAPLPQFSWLVAEELDWASLDSALGDLASGAAPFVATTRGVRVFTAPRPVVYLHVDRDEALVRFHRRGWDRVGPLATGASRLYAPDAWAPHVTLADHDLTPDLLPRVIEHLARASYEWTIAVDHVAVLRQAASEVASLWGRAPFRAAGP